MASTLQLFAIDAEPPIQLRAERLLAAVDQAISLPASPKVALLGPVSVLKEGGRSLQLLPALLAAYEQLLTRLAARGVTWVQLDEPVLDLPLDSSWQEALRHAYTRLGGLDQHLMLSTGNSPSTANLALACTLPVSGLHVQGGEGPEALRAVADLLPKDRELSVGVRTGNPITLALLRDLRAARSGRLWIAAEDRPDALAALQALRQALWRDEAIAARAFERSIPMHRGPFPAPTHGAAAPPMHAS
ncbi:MAG: hypothetical protein ABW220_19530 [Burkholderiaceae bacterium]